MINNFLFTIFSLVIGLIDYSNRKKIINYFKNKFQNQNLTIIDIGAHKGETIDFFFKYFSIDNIYAFEPNNELYNRLKQQKKYNKKNIYIYNCGVGEEEQIKSLNIMNDTFSSTFNSINENTNYFKKKKKILSIFFQNKNFLKKKQQVEIINLSKMIKNNKIKKIDVLKIDAEGYEYNIIKGIDNHHLKKIKYIYFEHHFDLMINKGYRFKDINKILNNNNFYKKFKLRMRFRKSFEYIYENSI